ncbi:hypothetical protein WJX73_008737 [Symbiochloris irregularis]|uniref:phospholipase D n=1 Tax=Symbiochloris irregularis TaxID=706552 RepID=A0AAW1NU64_9CHLO
MVLLHGHLRCEIYEAEHLGTAFYSKGSIFKSFFKLLTQNARQVWDKKKHTDRDCYVAIYAGTAELTETRIIPRTGAPVWNDTHKVLMAHDVTHIKLVVKDHDMIAAEHMGDVLIPAQDLVEGQPVEGWFPLTNKKGKLLKGGGRIRIKLTYMNINRNKLYSSAGEGGDVHFSAVDEAAYDERSGNCVVLYQDGHCGEELEQEGGLLVPFPLADGKLHHPAHNSTGKDMWLAIENAKHLVYVANWHFQPEVVNPLYPEGGSIGELFKRKAAQGVRVLISIWDEIDSKDDVLVYTWVEKKLHGGGAPAYFRDTGVVVKLMPRVTRAKQGLQKVVSERFGFAHHQKTLIIDSQHEGQTFLTCFTGGIDFCDRNWDNGLHTPGGFRYEEGLMPWHDCMCSITGPAAWDALSCYESLFQALAEEHLDKLLDLTTIADFVSRDTPAAAKGNPDAWNVQIFRCADSGSMELGVDFNDSKAIEQKGYRREKGVVVDAGLHSLYVHMIRSSKHYLYIENQFYVGSSFAWDEHQEIGANNLVPVEIALRIVRAIREKQRYVAYIVIPMHPERAGPQRACIVHWTWKTIALMYRLIAEALREHGGEGKPQDYLNVFCLGNRVREPKHPAGTNKEAEKTGSFPDRTFIHIHAKTMVVDDESVTISSANLNERSLSGSRDTELGMGGWQPAHTIERARTSSSATLEDGQVSYPRGQIYGYRRGLWQEHLGGNWEPCFEQPHSLQCVRRVNQLAQQNWEAWSQAEPTDTVGHLLQFPYQVQPDGGITPVEGADPLPTIGESIVGATHLYMPPLFTC